MCVQLMQLNPPLPYAEKQQTIKDDSFAYIFTSTYENMAFILISEGFILVNFVIKDS